MNRDQILALAVAASLAAGAAAVVLGGREEAGADLGGKETPADQRPVLDDDVKPKASPTPLEQLESKPGKLRDGGSVTWAEAPLADGGREIVRIAPPCVIPDCWTLADGGWNDRAKVDCEWTGHLGLADGGRRWRGCNAGPAAGSVGARCVPVACSVFAGDVESEVLR